MENSVTMIGHVLHMRVERWPKRILTWSPDRRGRGGGGRGGDQI